MSIGPLKDIITGLERADRQNIRLLTIKATGARNRYQRSAELGRVREAKNDREEFEKAMHNLEDYVPLSDREVIDVYKSITDKGIIILVEGDDYGKYWTYDEVLAEVGNT